MGLPGWTLGCTFPAARSSTATSVTVPDRHKITPEDLDTARKLADAVMAYIVELESRMAAQDTAADEGEAA